MSLRFIIYLMSDLTVLRISLPVRWNDQFNVLRFYSKSMKGVTFLFLIDKKDGCLDSLYRKEKVFIGFIM